MNITLNNNQKQNFKGYFSEKFALSAMNAAKKVDTAETISRLRYDKQRICDTSLVRNPVRLKLCDTASKIIKRIFTVVDKYMDNATEISPQWHSDFLITNYKLKDAEVLVDTKVPASLFPGHITERTLEMAKYFTPERVKQIEANLFKDYLNRNNLADAPQNGLKSLENKVNNKAIGIYQSVVKKLQSS